MKIFRISGSLRFGSVNTALLEAIRIVAPAGIEVQLAHGISEWPRFNPDLEKPDLEPAMPKAVIRWREQIG